MATRPHASPKAVANALTLAFARISPPGVILPDRRRRPSRSASRLGRLLVLTGARQIGKTTLVRAAFPELAHISLDDPAVRPDYTRLSALDWVRRYPRAILDEVQKAPSLVETLKAAYDRSPDVRYVLLGSRQILLLDRVRESLAGRAALEELWPLTLPEMEPVAQVRESRLLQLVRDPAVDLGGIPAAAPSHAVYDAHFERYLAFGGMPVVHDSRSRMPSASRGCSTTAASTSSATWPISRPSATSSRSRARRRPSPSPAGRSSTTPIWRGRPAFRPVRCGAARRPRGVTRAKGAPTDVEVRREACAQDPLPRPWRTKRCSRSPRSCS